MSFLDCTAIRLSPKHGGLRLTRRRFDGRPASSFAPLGSAAVRYLPDQTTGMPSSHPESIFGGSVTSVPKLCLGGQFVLRLVFEIGGVVTLMELL